ncbi:hypothetical protein F5X96DRAFT_675998 [Biscogniauxia mediterranea]|nr:hypothetical protein F5X96DRAFT_675998 [Biscogniauxia mediterranea]
MASEDHSPDIFNATKSLSRLELDKEGPPCTWIDPNGDLHLKVGTDETARIFVVCSKDMVRSSAFWWRLLYGGFAESKRPNPEDEESDWIVELPDDNPESMEILLSIVHDQYEPYLTSDSPISVSDLYELCVLTDKYGMTHVLRPWAKGWAKAMSPPVMWDIWHEFNYKTDEYRRRLWIAWELGDTVSFVTMAKRLLVFCSPTPDPQILEPPGLYDILAEKRLATIEKLLEFHRDAVDKLLNDSATTLCRRPDEHRNCAVILLGNTIGSLHKCGFWPIPQAKDVKESPMILMKTLKDMEAKGEDDCCTQSADLGAKIDTEMQKLMGCRFLRREHLNHMKAQAKKTGLP